MTTNRLSAAIATGDKLDVREFRIEERMSALFQLELLVRCRNPDLEFDRIAGQPASLTLVVDDGSSRTWTGICNDLRQLAAEPKGYSSYELSIVPRLWLATQRRNHRMFQQATEPTIVQQMLQEWKIEHEMRIDPGAYRAREYRVQYGESDYAFICRLLEHAGISFYFDDTGKMIVSDAPHASELWGHLEVLSETSELSRAPYATRVLLERKVRPGRYVMRDRDPRLAADYPLLAQAGGGLEVEAALERFHYLPGAFLCASSAGADTPVADDKGRCRSDEAAAAVLAQRRLEAKRVAAEQVSFDTNAHRLYPGLRLRLDNHPASLLGKELLLVGCRLAGTAEQAWSHQCEAVRSDLPYRPPLRTPKPKAVGVETATVVGPPGEEIHTDELGRIRVHFHWDRESKMDDNSSCWIHVSQPWAGSGFGGMNLPRVGQEVIVDFVGGDPDYPVVVGRLYTVGQQVPYGLPAAKAQSGWRSNTYPGGGGFNELMFNDSKDQQLVNLQAEKDMNQLVKHDETINVGNCQTISVGVNVVSSIGNNESASVGNDVVTEIGNDSTLSIGNNLQETIGNDRTTTIASAWRTVVGSSITESCGASCTRTVGLSDSLYVGALRSVTVGGAHTTSVGAAMTTTVAGLSKETVGLTKSISAGTSITLSCGASSITLDAGGTITLKGTNIVVDGSAHVQVSSALIDLN